MTMTDKIDIPESVAPTFNVLCPEMQKAYMDLTLHFKSCEKCRLILAGFGAPIYVYQQECQRGLVSIFKQMDVVIDLLTPPQKGEVKK